MLTKDSPGLSHRTSKQYSCWGKVLKPTPDLRYINFGACKYSRTSIFFKEVN